MKSRSSIEDSYRLSPTQHGMLFNRLYAPRAGVDIEQIVGVLREELHIPAFRRAWQRVVDHHPALRTTFRWRGLPEPLQLVHRSIAIPFEEHDWRGLDADRQVSRLEDYLKADRHQGFELDNGPLLRLAIFRLGNGDWRFVWTFPHVLLDGRSFPMVLEDVFRAYEALGRNSDLELPMRRPYRNYIERLQQQDLAAAEAFWRVTLKGFRAATALAADRARSPDSGESDHGEREVRLSSELTSSLLSFVKANGLAANTLIQGAWALLLSRYSGEDDVVFGAVRACRPTSLEGAESMVGVLINTLPVRVCVGANRPLLPWLKDIRAYNLSVRDHEHAPLVAVQEWSEIPRGTSLFESILVFDRASLNAQMRAKGGDWLSREFSLRERTSYPLTVYAYAEPELRLKVAFDRGRFSDGTVTRLLGHLQWLLEGLVTEPERCLGDIPLLTEVERHQLLVEWNDTAQDYPDSSCLHQLVEAQVAATPDSVAVVHRDRELTYRQLNLRANHLAHYLQSLGVGPGTLVGICLGRSLDMMVGLLGTLKAGGAYVPLDPAYPIERLEFMFHDARLRVVLTSQRLQGRLPTHSGVTTICLDSAWEAFCCQDTDNPTSGVTSEDLAYVIYTSGSTGKPKGVMVTHRNVVNFFSGMDDLFGRNVPGVWLATTSISFDISVLELFWTLARGFKVVISEDGVSPATVDAVRSLERSMEFSLFYFAATDDGQPLEQKYRLLLEGARYADHHGFRAVWTPERHFHSFGGLYPNPSVTSAAIAAVTQRVQICAGSVVLPLHHPVRVAEDWAVIDNLSQGRTGISFASGWHADDFVFASGNYEHRREIMSREIETVRKLWRGEAVSYIGGLGNEVRVRIFPQPLQRELPVWITAAGSPDTFRMAGEIGANILTHLLGQDIEDLRTKIAVYRKARREGGHGPGEGHVTLMIHTFVGENTAAVREKVREPFLRYLKTSSDLVRRLGATLRGGGDAEQPTEAEMQALWERAFDRYFETSGLFGTPETCLRFVERLKTVGVDELACLIDFGVDTDSVLESLKLLTLVKDESNSTVSEGPPKSVASLIRKHAVTHMQCTPSMAKILAMTNDSAETVGTLQTLLLGGELLPASLVQQLSGNRPRELFNMYGPTETCIWSTACRVGSEEPISIGRPIANTKLYVLDKYRQPVPVGLAGELFIGGAGVARGYLNRPELTAERFVQNPFSRDPSERLYRTGDLVRYWPDGRLEFLGRFDNQVKIRGYRIELGEIETILRQHPRIRDAVVAASDVAGATQLVAYLVPNNGTPPGVRDLRSFLGSKLPEYMIPAAFVTLDALPLTPNGKIDRRALPSPNCERQGGDATFADPRSPVEKELASIWAEVLGTSRVGVDDNFFELGGNSLSAVQIAFKIRQVFEVDVPLAAFFHAPTIGGLAPEVESKLGARLELASNSRPQSKTRSQQSESQPQKLLKPERSGLSAWGSIVPIQPRGAHPPFFAVHEGLGIAHVYGPLARHLGPKQPFYGLQAQGGADGRQPPYHPCKQVKELAALYLEEVRAVQPEGPYFLGGFCFGGIVAFEMARQLEAQKQQVGVVVLLDTLLDANGGTPSIRNRLQTHLARMSQMRSTERLSYVLGRVDANLRTEVHQRVRNLTRRLCAELARPTYAALGRTIGPDMIQQCFLAASDRMTANYRPKPISTRLILVRGADERLNSAWGWGGLAREGVEVHYVSANHLEMLSEPAVQQIAQIVSLRLEEARNGPRL
jgi:natural product biosynthesis luciferase-like monooxygenase protein